VAREKNPTDEREAAVEFKRVGVRGQVRDTPGVKQGVNQDVLCLGTNFFFSTDAESAREESSATRSSWEAPLP